MSFSCEKLISLPKSLYVSFRLFPFKQAVRMPILCRYNVKCLSLKGKMKVPEGGARTCMFRIGFGHVGVFDKKYSRSILEIDGTVYLEANGSYGFGHGCKICVMRGGSLNIGTNFSNTAEGTIICSKEIFIGKYVTTSWSTLIMDTDFHEVENTDTHEVYSCSKPVFIEDKVWICTRSIILKGSRVPSGSIVGAGAVVSKMFQEDNVLISGNPASVTKHGVTKYMFGG